MEILVKTTFDFNVSWAKCGPETREEVRIHLSFVLFLLMLCDCFSPLYILIYEGCYNHMLPVTSGT